jgi:signal transduction histidine kinase
MRKILVVDDESNIRKMMERRLGKFDYEVETVESGIKAIEVLKNGENFDLVLLDQMMPEKDGMETFENIKSLAAPPPVIMLTAHGSLHLAMEFMKSGGSDFAQKPIDFGTLNIQIMRAINQAKSDRKVREAEIARYAAEEASHLKDQFLASMSHEIRTPLGVIINTAQTVQRLAMRDELTSEIRDKLMNDIIGLGRHLAAIIEDILEMSEIEAGHMDIVFEAVDLRQMTDSLYSSLERQASEKGVKFEAEIPAHFPLIRANSKKLTQILINLIGNAIKFTENGFVKLRADLSKEDESSVVISVSDTGIGISEESLPKIFDRFKRVETSGKIPGTGLGLAITKSLVELMGGRIWLESELDQGTVFYFTIKKWG